MSNLNFPNLNDDNLPPGLKNRDDNEVIDYLEKENSYYEKKTQNQKDFKKNLFEEMKRRIKKNNTPAPYFYNNYLSRNFIPSWNR